MSKSSKYFQWLLITISTLFIIHLGYFVNRAQFAFLLFDVSALFLLFYIYYKYFSFNWPVFFIYRIALITSIPILSDDYFRFIWDGNLVISSTNPYQYLPSALPANIVFEGLNSKNYYSVYPPFLQLIFGLAAWLAKGNILANVIVLRLAIILADTGSTLLIIKILGKLNIPKNNVIFYALNPFIILELTGNLHFESVSIFFTLLAFYFLFQSNNLKYLIFSAISLAFAAQIKLLPIIFLPLIINKLGLKNGFKYCLIFGFLFLVFFLPFYNISIIQNISKSLNLYFQNFEFNASIYYFVKWAGIFINNNNPIQIAGPLLSLISLISIIWLSIKYNSRGNLYNFLIVAFLIQSTYLIFATTIHPWYLAPLVMFGVFGPFKFQIIWSFLIFLSYAAYQNPIFHENLWLVTLEYILVFGLLFFELKTNKIDIKKGLNKPSPFI